jgi:hypothetical protein
MAPRKASKPRSSSQFYSKNPAAKAKKDAYNKAFNTKPEQLAKRRELSAERRSRGIMGKGGKDMSHTKDGRMVPESPTINRGRNRGKK